ncbi:hypothetical protein TSAR_010441 [Trichomalopsis sarcophagae]|nr:hypothetical protein TSAR_010441 [Trichomalopsis sarcophagae]
MLTKVLLLVLLGCTVALGATYYPFPGDCSLFQECDEHLGGCVIKTCGPGTEFNPAVGVCDWPLADRSNCGNPDIDI